jgi:hypothetical protein
MDKDTAAFFTALSSSIQEQQFVKLTLSDRRYKTNELKNVFVKPVQLKAGFHLSFVYRYPTKDVTKNYTPEEAVSTLEHMLEKDFFKADLFTTTASYYITITKRGNGMLTQKAATVAEAPTTQHDKSKKRFVNPYNNVYLHELGVTTNDGNVRSDKQDKFRQINKYVEIVEAIVRSANLPASFRVNDMGSGKGYLTFALYDYLTNVLKLSPVITGVEMRQDLVDTCNNISGECGFTHLNFIQGSIEAADVSAADVLIALHACDTATDQAIYRGITDGAKIIICAPCCHKQIRKQIHPDNDLKAITKHGILEERQAEILTDTIRSLILELYGYKTKVFEFISTEHTPKNVLIVGVKTNIGLRDPKEILEQIGNLKMLFGVKHHHLEKLMGM